MAAGYDIGVSSSNAQSFSTPQTEDDGTVFNFSSPGAEGDDYDQTQTSEPTATAVATTKSPGSTTDVGTGGSPGTAGVAVTSTGTTFLPYILSALATLLGGIALYYYTRKK
jgi:hypothetical protein